MLNTTASTQDIAHTAIEIFLMKPIWEQGIILAMLVLGIVLLGWATLRFINSLRKDSHLRVTKDGLEFDTALDTEKIKKEDLTPMEQQLFTLMEKNNREKDKEIAELKAMIGVLQARVQELELENKLRQREEEAKDKQLVPLSKHIIFTNMKAMIEPGMSLDNIDISMEKKMVVNTFLGKCKVPVFRDNLLAIIKQMESSTDARAMDLLYTLPDRIYEWIQEYNQRAREIKIIFPDGTCMYGVPEIFITKFDEWHHDHVVLTAEKIRSTIFSSFYRTWEMRAIIIMDLLDTMFQLTELDVRATVKSLNGDLENAIQAKVASCKA